MKRTRILVVEDSLTVRRHLCEVLAADPACEVVGEATDGKQAIELCQRLQPDVMTLDMVLPELSGLAVTEYVMAYCPTPILVVSSSINRGELFKTYEALSAGAVEVMEKPAGDELDGNAADAAWERRFLANVKLVARVKVITHLRGRATRAQPATFAAPAASAAVPADRRNASLLRARDATHGEAHSAVPPEVRRKVIALGASTGGPGAIVEILRALPAQFPLPVLVVLHISEPFGTAFADWVDTHSANRVRMARDGERLRPGVYVAPPDRHLIVRDGVLRLSDAAPRHSCRPSVDVLFETLAQEYGATVAACLLTGMGQDGARGLLAIRRAGGYTVAQDETTSVVYGMPREARLLDAAERVLPLGEIGPALAALAQPLAGEPR
jgi:two-component system chemotaxis response regulator CheB